MKNNKHLALLLGFTCISLNLLAQTDEVETIAPDRPGYGDAVSIVPVKQFQVETGFGFESDNTYNLNEQIISHTTLLRYGLSKKIELRMDYNLANSRMFVPNGTGSISSRTGFMPWRLGMKASLLDNNGWVPAVTFIGMIGMPWTSTKEFRPDYVSPDLQLSFSNGVNDWLSICYNLGATWDGSSPNPNNYYALSAEFTCSEKIGAYVQGRGQFQRVVDSNNTSTSHNLFTEAGVVYYPKKNIQIDLSGGFQVAEFAPDFVSSSNHSYYFVSAGLSWRFPK